MSSNTCLLVLLYWILAILPYLRQCKASNAIDIEDLAANDIWVVTKSSPCTSTCGLGVRSEQLCPANADDKTNPCYTRQVHCLENWQCGLKTQTVTTGERLELDCLEKVMKVIGRFKFIMSWRFAKGIITSDNQFFLRYDNPGLEQVILDPVKEEDAGTYRCDILDTSHRRVKRMYRGIKVISPQVLRLDFSKGLSEWEKPADMWGNVSLVTGKLYPSSMMQTILLLSLSVSITVAMTVFLILFVFAYWKERYLF